MGRSGALRLIFFGLAAFLRGGMGEDSMADDKSKTTQREDPRMAALRQKRAAAIAKAGAGGGMSAESLQKSFRDTISELKKTTWPDRNTLTKSTGIVLAFIVATAVWVGVIDLLLTHASTAIFGR